MPSTQSKYVVDLKEWSLPQSEDVEHDLLDRVISKICRASMGIGEFKGGPLSEQLAEREEQLYDLIGGELREMSQEIVNETIDIWLRGLGDGLEGSYPELSVDFPYLRGEADSSPLTLCYMVEGGKAARTELLRADLEKALVEVAEESRRDRQPRAKAVATALRALADQIDAAGETSEH